MKNGVHSSGPAKSAGRRIQVFTKEAEELLLATIIMAARCNKPLSPQEIKCFAARCHIGNGEEQSAFRDVRTWWTLFKGRCSQQYGIDISTCRVSQHSEQRAVRIRPPSRLPRPAPARPTDLASFMSRTLSARAATAVRCAEYFI
jgi:hypothetical protein